MWTHYSISSFFPSNQKPLHFINAPIPKQCALGSKPLVLFLYRYQRVTFHPFPYSELFGLVMESTEQMNDPPATSLTHKYLHHSISLTHTILFLGSKFITPPLRWIVVLHSWEGFQWEDQCKKLVPDMIELLRYAMKDHEESILFRSSLFLIFLLFSFSFYHQPVCITRERVGCLIRFLVFRVVLDLERFCGLTGPLLWLVPSSTVRFGLGFKTLIQRERERGEHHALWGEIPDVGVIQACVEINIVLWSISASLILVVHSWLLIFWFAKNHKNSFSMWFLVFLKLELN